MCVHHTQSVLHLSQHDILQFRDESRSGQLDELHGAARKVEQKQLLSVLLQVLQQDGVRDDGQVQLTVTELLREQLESMGVNGFRRVPDV